MHCRTRWSSLVCAGGLALMLVLSSCSPAVTTTTEEPAAQPVAEVPEVAAAPETVRWCEGMTIRDLVGGGEGDEFATLLYRGALAAAEDLGPDVTYVWSMWDSETILNDLREAIASGPDGIVMNAFPGADALRPLSEQAAQEGILMTYQVVDIPEIRQEFGGGFVGVSDLHGQGVALGRHAVRLLDLQPGDRAGVEGPWGLFQSTREQGVVDALEEAGLIVDKITAPAGAASDPNLLTPTFTAYVLAHPDLALFVVGGGQALAQAPTYMQAAGLEPGQIGFIGFDLSPAVIGAFESGYVQATSDQQPFLDGYFSVLGLCLRWRYGFSSLVVDTGAGTVDSTNYQAVSEWAEQGYR